MMQSMKRFLFNPINCLSKSIPKQSLITCNQHAFLSTDSFNLYPNQYGIVKLNQRSMISVTGTDCFKFIQLMITNSLQSDKRTIAAMIVNDNANILCDLIIHRISGDPFDKELRLNALTNKNFGKRFVEIESVLKKSREYCLKSLNSKDYTPEPEQLVIECDSSLTESIIKTLNGRKVRDNIEIKSLPHLNVYAIYPKNFDYDELEPQIIRAPDLINERALFTIDPRLDLIGYRFVSNSNDLELIKKFACAMLNIDDISIDSYADYQNHRYNLGVPEGLKEMGHGKQFMLEMNSDYLNQIDLSKGSYCGNIPTFRVLSRKRLIRRLLPFKVDEDGGVKVRRGDIRRVSLFSDFIFDNQKVGEAVQFGVDYSGIGIFNMRLFEQAMMKQRKRHSKKRMGIELRQNVTGRKVQIWVPNWWPKFDTKTNQPLIQSTPEPFEQRLDAALRLIDDFGLDSIVARQC